MIITNKTEDQLAAIEERIAMILKVISSHNVAIGKIMAYIEREQDASRESTGVLQSPKTEESKEKQEG